jgi:hypothetical protein
MYRGRVAGILSRKQASRTSLGAMMLGAQS